MPESIANPRPGQRVPEIGLDATTVSVSGVYGNTFAAYLAYLRDCVIRAARGHKDGEDWAQEITHSIFEKRQKDPLFLDLPRKGRCYARRAVRHKSMKAADKTKNRDVRDEEFAVSHDVPRYGDRGPETLFEERTYWTLVRQAVALLPEPDRSIWIRINSEGMTYDEAMLKFKKSHRAIRTAIEKGNTFIREYLAPFIDVDADGNRRVS